MTSVHPLTAEQQAFTVLGSGVYVQACPGAGKTAAIISRLARLASENSPRHGIAVASFTNAAVDEFRQRCAKVGLDANIQYPNWLGTLDAFIRKFLVAPTWSQITSAEPTFLDSWRQLSVEVRLSGRYSFQGPGVSLDLFDSTTNVIDPDSIGHTGLRAHVKAHKARYESAAALKRRGLIERGFLTAQDARAHAKRMLDARNLRTVLALHVSARFKELIVDEGQDCSPADLEILNWLKDHGVAVSLVGDIDQAIYEFRGSDIAATRAFGNGYPVAQQLRFTGNFRSSATITKLAATLRQSAEPDIALGRQATYDWPVVLYSYGTTGVGHKIGQAFRSVLVDRELNLSRSIVLAHKRSTAQKSVGASTTSIDASSAKIARVARAVADFWSSEHGGVARQRALVSIEKLLLEYMGILQAGELPQHVSAQLVNKRSLRRQSFEFVSNVPPSCGNTLGERRAWIAAVRQSIQRLNLQTTNGVTINSFFRQPSTAAWCDQLNQISTPSVSFGTIHEAKGREYEAVCVVVPPDRQPQRQTSSLITSWLHRQEDEAKRVIYVGVTRAERLVALALPNESANQVAELFAELDVPFERHNLDT